MGSILLNIQRKEKKIVSETKMHAIFGANENIHLTGKYSFKYPEKIV